MTDILVEPLPLAASEACRYVHLRGIDWEESGNGQEYTFTGTASIFGVWSHQIWTPRGVFRERFLPGAFVDVLERKPDVRFLKNHNKDLVLARTKSGTLKIQETNDELEVWARVAKTSYAEDLRLSMERGDIDQMSIQFAMDYDEGADDRWYEDKESGEIRHDVIKVSDLYDVSVVTFPAYEETSAYMRSVKRDVDGAVSRGIIVPKDIRSHKSAPNLSKLGSTEIHPRTYVRCRQVLTETVWAMQPSYIALFVDILDERMRGYRPTDEELRERIGIKRDNEPTSAGEGEICVIPIVGPIMSRAGAMQEMSGAHSVDDMKAEIQAAVNDPGVSHIVLDMDTPGGSVDGVPELASYIMSVRDQKPIIAVANYLAASAGLWIMSAASEAVASPSAEVGSLGVYTMHNDYSAQLEMKGVKPTLVSAGEYKTELNPFEPLSEEAKARLQEEVDDIYKTFVSAVAEGRGKDPAYVEENFGQGRTMSAEDALKVGMVDRIATFDDVIAGLRGRSVAERSREFAGFIAEYHNLPHDIVSSRDNTAAFLGVGVTQALKESGGPAGVASVTQVPDDGGSPVGQAESPVVTLKRETADAVQRAREERIRLTKELLRS